MYRKMLRSITGVVSAVMSLNAIAAPAVPDSGALGRETQRQMAPPMTPPAPEKMPIQAPSEQEEDAGDAVLVSGFVFEGATLISQEELDTQTADLIGQRLTLRQIESVARRIVDLYLRRGWVARAYVPAQEITDGKVRIIILEAKLGAVRTEGEVPEKELALVGRFISARNPVEEQLSAKALDRGILLANDLPGVKVTGVLSPGEQVGEVRLDAKVEPEPWIVGDVYVANHGSRAVDNGHQYSAGVAIAPGNGQLVSVRALVNRDLETILARYGMPLGDDGARLTLQGSYLHYELGGNFDPLDVEGYAQTYTASVAWPWLRSSAANLYLSASIGHRRYDDDILDTPIKRKRINALNLGINGDRIDHFAGGGRWQGSLVLTAGNLDLSALPEDLALDRAGPETHGGYGNIEFMLSRLQWLNSSTSFYASLSGQLAANNLDSSEKFALGGPNGIRAYPVFEASGDSGWLLNLELRRDFGNGWRATAFLDTGGIRQNQDTWAGWNAGSDVPNTYHLSGAGFGLSWVRPDNFAFDAIIATPVGSHKGSLPSDKNQDGSDRDARGWIKLTKFF